MEVTCDLINLALIAALMSFGATSGSKCKLPDELKGQWYQDGLGRLTIRNNSITEKGVCRDKMGDLFLFENRHESCFRCLFILTRHHNVFQYRETHCLKEEKGSLKKICANIDGGTTLYTVVREPYATTACPLTTAYKFDYSQTSEDCTTPGNSYVRPCTRGKRLWWKFQKCMGLSDKATKQMDCVATWKDGSDRYLYGRFLPDEHSPDNRQYRCLIYKTVGPTASLAMSIDATCRGLGLSSEGPMTMALTQDLTKLPKPSCHYPVWATEVTWRDVTGKHTLSALNDTRLLVRLRMRGGKIRKRVESRCIEPSESQWKTNTSVFLVFTTHECATRYQCLLFKRIGDGVLLFKAAKSREYGGKLQCPDEEDYDEEELYIDNSLTSRACPNEGRYSLQSRVAGCEGQLSLEIGCKQSDSTVVQSSCSDANRTEQTVKCLGHWTSDNKTYVITKQMDHITPLIKCYGFGTGKADDLSVNKHCRKGIRHIFHTPHGTTIGERENCVLPSTQLKNTADFNHHVTCYVIAVSLVLARFIRAL